MSGFITSPYVPQPYIDYTDPANVKAFWEQARAEALAELYDQATFEIPS